MALLISCYLPSQSLAETGERESLRQSCKAVTSTLTARILHFVNNDSIPFTENEIALGWKISADASNAISHLERDIGANCEVEGWCYMACALEETNHLIESINEIYARSFPDELTTFLIRDLSDLASRLATASENCGPVPIGDTWHFNTEFFYYCRPDESDREILATARKLESRKERTARDLLTLYLADKFIGRQFQGFSSMYSSDSLRKSAPVDPISDSIQGHVFSHPDRFHEISDCWKGEDNWAGPTDYWLSQLKIAFPNSIERWMVEWDMVFHDSFLKCLEYGVEPTDCTEEFSGCLTEDEQEAKSTLLKELVSRYRGTPIEAKFAEIETKRIYVPFND